MIERKFIKESIKRLKTKNYVKNSLKKAGVVDVDIQRTTLATRIGIIAERPGLVIGRKGGNIRDLTDSIKQELGIESPQIEVADVQNPNLEPEVMAGWIKRMIERGTKPKRIIKRVLEKIMDSGAIGAEIIVKGTQSKGARARKERVAAGYLKKAGEGVKSIKETKTQALMKQGVIGITVRIVGPDVVFPDRIIIKKPEKEKELEEAEEEEKPEEKVKKVEKKKKEFKCPKCEKSFASTRGLKIHERVHKKPKKKVTKKLKKPKKKKSRKK